MGQLTLLLAALVASASAVPTGSRQTCSTSCSDATKFSFDSGFSYNYRYEVNTTASRSRNPYEEESKTNIRGKATVGVIGPCEFVLTLDNIVLDGSSESKDFSAQLEKNPLRFGFDDGKISSVCSSNYDKEHEWVLNFKRGILSTFQNNMKDRKTEVVREVDVTGTCDTTYNSLTSSEDTIVEKKEKKDCRRIPSATHTSLPKPLQKLPIISADQVCQQTITAGVITKVVCKEVIELNPLLDSKEMLMTVVDTKLDYEGQTTGVVYTGGDFSLETIEFTQNQKVEEDIQEEFMMVEKILGELEVKSYPTIDSQVPSLFSDLVSHLRNLDVRHLKLIYQSNKGTRVWRFLIDAAPLIGTAASTEVVVELIKENDMSAKEADIWYASLSYIQKPEVEMFNPLTELVQQEKSTSAFIGISSLIKQFCKTNENCLERKEINSLVGAMENILGSACRTTNMEEKSRVLIVLRSLTIAGVWNRQDVIERCFEDERNPDDIRVAALTAFLNAPCSYDRSRLMSIYSDAKYDYELRISAYLSLMSCPTEELIMTIKQKLESESVNQVGAFVWSHLSNLQESASHEKQSIRLLIGDDDLAKKFNSSDLKLSRNMESSFYMESLGTGSTIESNVIFSKKSFLPRSGMFNFSVDLFGETVNLFEVGGRFEGFEIFAERFFGPNGYYPDETVAGVLSSLRQSKMREETFNEESFEQMHDEPEGSYYLRILGNDVHYHNFHGIENFFEKYPEFDMTELISRLLSSGKTGFSHTYQIMDTELIYPTISGLPLRITLNGSATIGLDIDGHFKFNSVKDIDINGHLYPSSAFELDASMVIDSQFKKSGIKQSIAGQTSLEMEGRIKIEGSKIINIDINMPKEDMKIMSLRSKTDLIGSSTEKVVYNENDFEESCRNIPVLGISLCKRDIYESYYKEISYYVKKTDEHDKYKFRFSKDQDRVTLLIDTPNSVHDRRISFEGFRNGNKLFIDIHTPWKTFNAETSYSFSDNLEFSGKALVDSRSKYDIMFNSNVHSGRFGESVFSAKPSFVVKSSDQAIIDISSSIETIYAEKVLSLKLESHGLIEFLGEVSRNGKELKTNISSSLINVSATGSLDLEDKLQTNLDIEYSIKQSSKEKMNFYLQLKNESLGYTTNHFVDTKLSMSNKFDLAATGSLEVHNSQDKYQLKSKLKLGDNFVTEYEYLRKFSSGVIYDIMTKYSINSDDFDLFGTEELLLSGSNFHVNNEVKINQMEYKTEIESEILTENGFFKTVIEMPTCNLNHKITYKMLGDRHYSADISSKYNDRSFEGGIEIEDQSVYGKKIDFEVGLRSNLEGDSRTADLKLITNDDMIKINFKHRSSQGLDSFKLKATSRSISLNSNIIKPVSLEAKIDVQNSKKYAEISGSVDGKTLDASLRLSNERIEGNLIFGEFMKKFIGEILDNGATIQVYISPEEKIEGSVKYEFGSDSYISLALETPFAGYHKQSFHVGFQVGAHNEFSGQSSVTWKNIQIFSTSANVKLNSANTKLDLKINADESYFGMSRGVFSVDHKMRGSSIETSINGNIDGTNVLRGYFKALSTDTFNKKMDVSLKSPLMDEMKVSLLLNTLENFEVDLVHGKNSLKAKYEITDLNDSVSEIKFFFDSPQITKVSGKASLTTEGERTGLKIEGLVREMKYSADFVYTVKPGKEYELKWRIIQPNVSPIRGNLSVTTGAAGKYVGALNFNRFWSDFERVELHSVIVTDSSRKMKFNIKFVTPETRSFIDSSLLYDSSRVSVAIKAVHNGEKYTISTDIHLDEDFKKIVFDSKFKHNDSSLFQTSLNYKRKLNVKDMKINFELLGFSLDVTDKLICHSDVLNFENTLEGNVVVNGKRHYANIQSNVLLKNKKMDVFATFDSNTYGVHVSFEPNSTHEKIILEVLVDDEKYSVSVGGELKNDIGSFNLRVKTPIADLEDVNFSVNVNNSSSDKHISVHLKKSEENIISFKGNLIGDFMEIELLSPFEGLRNFHSYASMNRSKRSVEFSVMNDDSSAGIVASFNSLSIHMKSTLLGSEKDASLVLKSESGKITLDYHRGKRYINMIIQPTGQRRSFNLTLKSEISGMEFLALIGRLDGNTASFSSQLNDDKMSIEGTGKISRLSGDLKFTIQTPFEGYGIVNVDLSYNMRRGKFILNALSPGSDFKISFEKNIIDIYIPNSIKPTIVKGKFTLYDSNLSVSSRFPFLKSFHYEHKVSMGSGSLSVSTTINYNGLEIFKFTMIRNASLTQVSLDLRRQGHHSMIFLKKVGYESLEFVFQRDSTQLKVKVYGSGNMPTSGKYSFMIQLYNNFRGTPRTIQGDLTVDRTGSQKKILLEVTDALNRKYEIDLEYNINLQRPQTGTYTLGLTVPGRGLLPLVQGSWNLANHDDINMRFAYGRMNVIVSGKLHLLESDLEINGIGPNPFKIIWRYHKESSNSQRTRDHFVHVGFPDRFVMFKLKGTASGLKSGDIETAVQIKRFMPSPFEAHVTWSRDSTGLKGTGSFTLGSRSGEFNLKKLKRDASSRSLTISFEARTNIPNYKKITVEGNYSFNNGAVFNLDVTWDVSKFAVHFDITDIMNKRTNQTASLSIPGLGDVQIEFGHDFRRNKKKFRIVAKYGGKESHLKADWTINSNYTKGSAKIDVQSRFIGHLSLKANYDVQDINNASAKVEYKRENKFANINWTRELTANELNAKLTFESSNRIVPSAKIEVHAQFTNGFSLNVLLQRSDRKINLKFKMTPEGIEAELHTPYQGFELIKGKLTYDLRRSQKTVHLIYERGDRKMNMDISIRAQRRRGKMTVSTTTPFDFMRSLEIKANWQNGKGKLTYKRNDNVTYTLSGDFDIKSDSSSVDLTFVPSSGAPMNIAFSFNIGSLASGKGQYPEELAKLSLDVFQKHISCELKGFRSSSRIYLEFEAETSFEQFKKLEFKLDSGLDTQKREGLFELSFNDHFIFKVKNSFERMGGSGFYWRSEFDSSLTKLPGLVIGFGREGDHTILTVGTGEGKELTIKFKIEDNKVSGELSIPSLNIRDAHYEASYRFTSPNVLKLNVLIDLQSGKKFEATVIYDSDGVQGRLASSHFGNHSARVRRSVSNDGFLGEIGFDDYRILLRGNLLRNDIKRGFEIKTEILGETVSIEAFVENNGQTNGQMKFLVETSFEGYEKLGGLLSYKVENNRIMGNTELYTSSNSYPKIFGTIEISKSSSKITLDISGKTYVLELSSLRKYNNGYEASLKIKTPHYSLSHINLNGKFRTDALKNLDAKLEISYPDGDLKLNCRYDIASANMFTDVLIDYTYQNVKIFHFDSKINGVSDKLDAEINLDSKYMRQPFRMGFLAERKTKFDAQLKTMMSINGMQHVFEFESKKVTENHILTLLISSPNTQGRHYIMLEYNLFNFNQIKRFQASLSYTGTSTSSVSLVYAENIILKVISPYGKYEVQADITRNKFSLSCNSPNCHHEFVLNMHKHLDNLKYDMNLKTSLLPYEVSYLIEINMESSNKFFFESTLTMDTTHSLKVESSHNRRNIDVSFNLETSLFDINRFDVNSKIFNDRNKEATMEIIFAGKTHRINIKFIESEGKISFLVNSPYLSGETLKAEASVNTKSEKLDLDALLRFNGKTFATKLRYRNTEKMYASLEIKTPYRGYRKMNFVASYEQTDKIVVTFNANKPLKLKFEVEVGKDGEEYVSSIDIVTPFAGYENISVNAVVPMNKIAPKVTLNLLDEEYGLGFDLENKKYSKECQFDVSIGGTQYSAGGQIRYKAPFELGYFYRLPSINNRFHIMTDSSIYKAVLRPLFIMW